MAVNPEVLNDPLVASLAQALSVANRTADAAGWNAAECIIHTEQAVADDGHRIWRVDYAPPSPPGVYRRGGDFIVEVNADDGTVHRTLRGQ
jgi:hypothetical protein